MEQKSKQLAQLTNEQVEAFRAIETAKKAAKVLMGQLMQECQQNIMAIMQSGDKFWTDTCKELGITPSENLFIDPANNTLCEFVDEDDEPCGDECPKCDPETPAQVESGFDLNEENDANKSQ